MTRMRVRREGCPVSWIGVLLVLLAMPVQAQEAVRYDSSAVTVRRPADSLLESYRADPAFDYSEDEPEVTGTTLRERFRQWVRELLRGLFDPELAPLRRWVTYFLVAVILGFAVLTLLRMGGHGLFSGTSDRPRLRFETVDDDLNAIDFDAQIEAAVAEDAYRWAVRLLYLRTLKHLADAGLIVWMPDKTNHAYVQEVRQSPRGAAPGPDFEELTTLFEYIWYGDFDIDRSLFDQLLPVFDTFRISNVQQGNVQYPS